MSRSERIELKYPVQLADKQITELTMRAPTIGDMVKNSAENLASEARLMAQLCNVNENELLALDMFDYAKLQEQLIFFRRGKTLKEIMDEGDFEPTKNVKL